MTSETTLAVDQHLFNQGFFGWRSRRAGASFWQNTRSGPSLLAEGEVSHVFAVRKYISIVGLAAGGAGVLLVAAAGASGVRTQSGVTQKAMEAPLPVRADRRKQAGLQQVVCPSKAGCIATGSFDVTSHDQVGHLLVLREHGGKWTVEASPADVSINGSLCLYGYGSCGPVLACPAFDSCAAVAHGPSDSELLTGSSRSWRSSEPQLPSGLGSSAGLSTLSCGSPGNCTAVGSSQPDYYTNAPLLFSERDGAWGAGVEAQLPPDAATTPNPNGFVLGGGFLSVVACPAAGNCVAAGSYGENVAGEYGVPWLAEPWITTEQAGQWQPGVKVQLPGGASTESYQENDPFIGFTGLSCPSVGNCTAVGGYTTPGGEEGLILIERNGVWSQPIRAPLPDGHQPPNWPNEDDNPVGAVSCPDPGDCAAIGVVGGYDAGPWLGWLLSERHGTWKSSIANVAAPDGKVSVPGNLFLASVTCPTAGNCVAVGTYHHGRYGLILIERNGKWRPGIRPARPANAATKKAWTNLDSVSCASTNHCIVVGQYKTRSGNPQGLIINLSLH